MTTSVAITADAGPTRLTTELGQSKSIARGVVGERQPEVR